MFISQKEKNDIKYRLLGLEIRVNQLLGNVTALQDAQNIASCKVKAAKMKRSVEGWTPEARAIHGERMKLMWAARKAAA